MSRSAMIARFLLVGGCGCILASAVHAQDATTGEPAAAAPTGTAFSDIPEDPTYLLHDIRARRAPRESLLPVAPLKPIHDAMGRLETDLYDATHIRFGISLVHLFQFASDALPGFDKWGTTTDIDLVASWELIDVGQPTMGHLLAQFEGRWDYGTTGPQDLGFVNLAAGGGTGNAFSAYTPTFLPVRNLYWEQGSPEAGWGYRVGKITPDAILATSRLLTPVTTFQSNLATGFFANGYADSGVGAVGFWHPTDNTRLVGLISDANGDRQTFGSPGKGDFYTAFEFGLKLFPKTEKAGFSKFTIWHADANSIGPINAMTGAEGWGMSVLLEHELTDDGSIVGVGRWSRSWKGAAIWEQQAGGALLFYDLGFVGKDDGGLLGVAFNWVSPLNAARDEYNLEVFYRFPLFPGVDTTLSYQSVFDPAFTTEFDQVSVFGIRLRTTF